MDNFSHSDAFKRHALSLIEYGGMTLDEVAQQIDVSKATLENWH
jgi:transposase